MPHITLLAPAKINLGLRVLTQRTDGYHNIDSIFVAVDLCDVLAFSHASSITVSSIPTVTTTIEENLVYKAAKLFQDFTGKVNVGANIVVTKRIPTGAGLGGGSSDAATTLLGLNALWECGCTLDDLLPLATKLGSDVPFFLYAGVACVRGRGEIVEPVDTALPWTVLIVHPDVHTSTVHAYRELALAGPRSHSETSLQSLLTSVIEATPTTPEQFDVLCGNGFENDFQRIPSNHEGVHATMYALLRRAGAIHTSLTGSGSAVYGLFADAQQAATAASTLAPFKTYICRPMSKGLQV